MREQSGEGIDEDDPDDRVLGDPPPAPEEVWRRAMTHALDPANSYDPELVPDQPGAADDRQADDLDLHPASPSDDWSDDDLRWDRPEDPFDRDSLDDDAFDRDPPADGLDPGGDDLL